MNRPGTWYNIDGGGKEETGGLEWDALYAPTTTTRAKAPGAFEDGVPIFNFSIESRIKIIFSAIALLALGLFF